MDNLEKKLKEVKQETQESKRDLDKVQLELQQLQTFITVQVDRIPRILVFFPICLHVCLSLCSARLYYL